MENYKLTEDLNQRIVDGINEGYREYLEVRREKAKLLRVSAAYAWVKGNHIDDKVAGACEDLGVKSKLSKAGLTWQYLQFNIEKDNVLFIIKNARYFNSENVSKGKDANGKMQKSKMTYMAELMKINSHIEFSNIPTLYPGETVQLELFEDYRLNEEDHQDISELKFNYEKFYISTYEIDENQMISKISLWMPSPVDNKAYLIEDLTGYINASHDIEIDDDLKDVLLSTSIINDVNDAHIFGIGVGDGEEEQKSKKS